jgi:hypothetical protein
MKPFLFFLAVTSVACVNLTQDPTDTDTENTEAPDVSGTDTGKLCVYDSPPGAPNELQNFRENAPVFFQITFDDCVSACIRDEVTECSIDWTGEGIFVHSSFSYNEPPKDEVCIDICETLDAVCESPGLKQGTYEVRHGHSTYELTIPSNNVEPCLPAVGPR